LPTEHDPFCPEKESWAPNVCGMCRTLFAVREDERERLIGDAVWDITVDKEGGMAYIWTIPERIFVNTSGLTTHRDAYIDIDASGRVIGIEIDNWPGVV